MTVPFLRAVHYYVITHASVATALSSCIIALLHRKLSSNYAPPKISLREFPGPALLLLDKEQLSIHVLCVCVWGGVV